MSSANVLPSAPAYRETKTQTALYPILPTQPDNNFRKQKANEVLKYLSDEVSHYRLVAKNINVRRPLSTTLAFLLAVFLVFFPQVAKQLRLQTLGFLRQFLLAVLPLYLASQLLGLPGFTKNSSQNLSNTAKS